MVSSVPAKLGSKITADGDRSHEIKRRLLLGRKLMTNLDTTLKTKDITLPTKVHLLKAVVFPVVMNGCESWIIKKAKKPIIISNTYFSNYKMLMLFLEKYRKV